MPHRGLVPESSHRPRDNRPNGGTVRYAHGVGHPAEELPVSDDVRTDAADRFAAVVGTADLLCGGEIGPDYGHDEALTVPPVAPAYLARPSTPEQVAALLAAAAELGVPVTARGSATGLSGACRPEPGGLVISLENIAAIIQIDVANQVAVVQPGVTLADLDAATAAVGLMYTVFPGELSASVGGNAATNAGGMRAVKYGVTRHNVLGLQAALPSGELLRTGGKITKVSSGVDLTQLLIGSEGTLAVITEVTVRLYPRLKHAATLLIPFDDLDTVMAAVPEVVASGADPSILEYLDALTLAAITYTQNLELGIDDDVRQRAQAHLVIGLENRDAESLDGTIAMLGELLEARGAIDTYVLQGPVARALIEAREKAFWTGKAAGADDVIDVVVPRAAMPEFLTGAREFAAARGGGLVGCGHAGDGNVHLAVFCPDAAVREELLHEVFALAVRLGGAISGEHGLGRAKLDHFVALTDPVHLQLLRQIKNVFDPAGILNPGLTIP